MFPFNVLILTKISPKKKVLLQFFLPAPRGISQSFLKLRVISKLSQN